MSSRVLLHVTESKPAASVNVKFVYTGKWYAALEVKPAHRAAAVRDNPKAKGAAQFK